ncbi:MAG TPA: uridine kinase [Actinomycetota bacterium]|nr:uridine kinase [Actinomycetota bacterium]
MGVAGGSGSGKTTLCQALTQQSPDVSVLDLDAYYLDRSHLLPAERDRLNFDEPAAFDTELLSGHLRRLARGETIGKPVYSFASHTRVGTERFVPGRFVLVEGLFSLWWEDVRGLWDLTVYVDAPVDIRLKRRIDRDIATRGRTVESVIAQYARTVRPMHERYIEPTRQHARVVLSNEGTVETALVPIVEALRRLGVSGDG